jgi:hypothetical protein
MYVCLFPSFMRGAGGPLQRVEARLKRLPDLAKWLVYIVSSNYVRIRNDALFLGPTVVADECRIPVDKRKNVL